MGDGEWMLCSFCIHPADRYTAQHIIKYIKKQTIAIGKFNALINKNLFLCSSNCFSKINNKTIFHKICSRKKIY